MSDLSTTYMGISLKNPIVVSASPISSMIDQIQKTEEAGAGALVIRSLFEEQIQINQQVFDDDLSVGSESFAEALSFFPTIEHGQADEHLSWVEKTRQAVKMPLFASLNAVSPGAWVRFARQLEATGVDGLELNIYTAGTHLSRTGAEVEENLYEIAESVMAEVDIPVAVKLSPFYTSVVNVAGELDRRGVDALVLFNRFMRPTIDIETESLHNEVAYSTSEELKLPLRRVARLYGRVKTDLAISTGVHTGADVIRSLLGGATVAQITSTLYIHDLSYISTMLHDVETWMAEKGYQSVDQFRGKVSQQNIENPFAFERAQYVNLLLSQ